MARRFFSRFITLESTAGIVLFCAMLIALVIDNTPWQTYYRTFFNDPIILFGGYTIGKSLQFWINDGLMPIFFLLVGLEIKRECCEGELRVRSKAMLPCLAAVGGMVVPALFYLAFTYHDPIAIQGWAIPMATDTAFSLGILVLLGPRVPVSAKIFLTALAIFDDVGAIIVIVIFYTQSISVPMLVASAVCLAILYLLNRYHVVRLIPYLLMGVVLWFCVLQSGVHPTLAGLFLALFIPLRHPTEKKSLSPLAVLEQKIHPWVAFGILPIFALANAGVPFQSLYPEKLYSTVVLGIAGGLFIGKVVGVWGASTLAVRCGFAELSQGLTHRSIFGLAWLTGIGFTMSLFIGDLSFGILDPEWIPYVRFAVLVGSALSGLVGYFVLRQIYVKSTT